MSGIGSFVTKAQELVASLGSAPMPTDHPFCRNARPFAIYTGVLALAVMGVMAIYYKDTAGTIAVVTAVGAVVQQFGQQRSLERRAATAADADVKKSAMASGQGG